MGRIEDGSVSRLDIDGHKLWEGCILASCVHAVMLAEYPFILNENEWSGGIYVTRNEEGGKAALVFSDENELLLGMFCDFRSQRAKLVLSDQYARSHYKEAPEDKREMAQALSILFEAPVGEKELPFVTAGFWEEEKMILSRDSDEDWFQHGGHVLATRLMPFEESMPYYQASYSMDVRRMEIAQRIYRERIRKPKEKVILTEEEIEVITAIEPYNRDVCLEVFGKFGVVFEENAK